MDLNLRRVAKFVTMLDVIEIKSGSSCKQGRPERIQTPQSKLRVTFQVFSAGAK